MKTIPSILSIVSLTLMLGACKSSDTDQSESADMAAIPYPLETCIVSGKPLGSMGEPVVIQHDGREVRFCCDHCIPKFRKNPEQFLSKLDPAKP